MKIFKLSTSERFNMAIIHTPQRHQSYKNTLVACIKTYINCREKDKNNDVNSGTLSEDAEKCLLHNDPCESRGSSREMRLLGTRFIRYAAKL